MCILLKYDRNIATRGQKTCARQDGRINNTLQPGQPDFVKIQPVQPDSALFFPLDTTQVGLSGLEGVLRGVSSTTVCHFL